MSRKESGSRWPRGIVVAFILLVALSGVLGGCSSRNQGGVVSPALKPRSVAGGILFQFRAEGASVVSIVGDFNNWSPSEDPMSDEDRDGVWTIVLPLPPGSYQYKYVVNDSRWLDDPSNPDKVPDGFGGNNSVVNVR